MVTSREEQALWVDRFRASGLRMRAFAREHGLVYHRFVYWVAQDARRQQQRDDSTDGAEFVALAACVRQGPGDVSLGGPNDAVTVRVGSAVVALSSTLDPVYVGRIIREIAS